MIAAIHRNLNNAEETSRWMSKAVALASDNIQMLIPYASDLLKLGRIEDAENTLAIVERLQPKNVAALVTRGQLYYETRDFVAATGLFVEALGINPEFALAHLELAHTLLMRGDWTAGWREYGWRYKLEEAKSRLPNFNVPHWNGMKHPARVLLIADQGFGDSIQFSRYIPMVAERCKHVSLIRSKALSNLLDSISGITTCFERWQDISDIDAYSTLSELPRVFQTTASSIPACNDLLATSSESRQRWRERFIKTAPDAKLRVGIAWAGRDDFKRNYLGSVSTKLLKPLLEDSEIEFISLQVGDKSHQATELNITDFSSDMMDFLENAAAIQALDLVITADTSVVHLAGTLGQPTWLLLNRAPDWRWAPMELVAHGIPVCVCLDRTSQGPGPR